MTQARIQLRLFPFFLLFFTHLPSSPTCHYFIWPRRGDETTTMANAKLGVCRIAVALLLLLARAEAFAFAPSPRSPSVDAGRRRSAPRPARGSRSRTTIAAASEAEEDRGEGGGATAEDDADAYDFDAGFRDRLAREGGATGVRVKAAKRSVDDASRAARRQVANSARGAANSAKEGTKELFEDIGLLSKTGWGLTVLSLGAVVIVAVAAQFAGPPQKSFADLSTREQLERLNTAREEPEVTFGRAGFKI